MSSGSSLGKICSLDLDDEQLELGDLLEEDDGTADD